MYLDTYEHQQMIRNEAMDGDLEDFCSKKSDKLIELIKRDVFQQKYINFLIREVEDERQFILNDHIVNIDKLQKEKERKKFHRT